MVRSGEAENFPPCAEMPELVPTPGQEPLTRLAEQFVQQHLAGLQVDASHDWRYSFGMILHAISAFRSNILATNVRIAAQSY